jgi:hypothetical protein
MKRSWGGTWLAGIAVKFVDEGRVAPGAMHSFGKERSS